MCLLESSLFSTYNNYIEQARKQNAFRESTPNGEGQSRGRAFDFGARLWRGDGALEGPEKPGRATPKEEGRPADQERRP